MTSSPVQVMKPRNLLKEKVGSALPAFDEAALKRAEAALASLSGEFQTWMEEEVNKLVAARDAARAAGWDDASLDHVFGCSHDAKGLGATYEYPLVTRLAGSLCRLVETPAGKEAARKTPQLVNAHVEAIRATVRDRIKELSHPVARALLGELETQVDQLGVAPL
jgi:hypothetical protein